MKREELRLELLKLTYAHGRTPEEAIARAKELEVFVQDTEANSGGQSSSESSDSEQHAGNPSILD